MKRAADGVEKLLKLVLLGLAITALGEGLELHKIRGEEEVWEPLPLPLQAASANPCRPGIIYSPPAASALRYPYL